MVAGRGDVPASRLSMVHTGRHGHVRTSPSGDVLPIRLSAASHEHFRSSLCEAAGYRPRSVGAHYIGSRQSLVAQGKRGMDNLLAPVVRHGTCSAIVESP
jgi:hypothetical protein